MKNILIFRTTVAGSQTDRQILTSTKKLSSAPPVPAPNPPIAASLDDNRSEISQTTRGSVQPARTKRKNLRRRCKIVAAFCITYWLVAVAIAIAVAFLVQNAVRSKKGVNVTLSPLNETLANSTVTSVIG